MALRGCRRVTELLCSDKAVVVRFGRHHKVFAMYAGLLAGVGSMLISMFQDIVSSERHGLGCFNTSGQSRGVTAGDQHQLVRFLSEYSFLLVGVGLLGVATLMIVKSLAMKGCKNPLTPAMIMFSFIFLYDLVMSIPKSGCGLDPREHTMSYGMLSLVAGGIIYSARYYDEWIIYQRCLGIKKKIVKIGELDERFLRVRITGETHF